MLVGRAWLLVRGEARDKAGDCEAGECQREGEWQTPSTRPSSLPSLWGALPLASSQGVGG